MSLQAELDAFKANFETNVAPPEAVAVIHRTTQALIDSGAASHALKAGDTAPDFTAKDADGTAYRLGDLLAKGPVVISFYRGVWYPYCNIELKALEQAAADVAAQGATLIAISPQTAAQSRKAQRDNGLSFPILSDPGNRIAEAFGLKFRLHDDLIALYQAFGIDLPQSNGDDSWTLPMPGRYVVRSNGEIAYAEVNPDYTQRPEPAELLPVINRVSMATA